MDEESENVARTAIGITDTGKFSTVSFTHAPYRDNRAARRGDYNFLIKLTKIGKLQASLYLVAVAALTIDEHCQTAIGTAHRDPATFFDSLEYLSTEQAAPHI